MYILKNALISIKRNKGRNILIAIIITAIAASLTIALSIISSANTIVNAYENKYDYESTIEMNRNSVIKNLTTEANSQSEKISKFSEVPILTIEEVENYGDSKYLKSYYYTYSVGVNANNLEEATDKLEKTTTTTTTTRKPIPSRGDRREQSKGSEGYSETKTTKKTEVITNPNALNGAFTLVGYNTYESMKEFIEGSYVITLGIVSDDFTSNFCVINEELASINNLNVGDTITVVNPNNSKLTYELIISGIFKDNDEENNSYSMYTNSVNKIITNANFVKKLTADDTSLKYVINPTYILVDKNNAEEFKNEIVNKGLSEFYQVTNNIDSIEKQTEPISNVKTFAITFLLITLIIGIIVLLVINMINVRERKYEIGVLRTIGMSKIKVISQFVLELMIVSSVGLLLGGGIGAYTSVPVANKLLEQEISSQKSESKDIRKNFGDFENKSSNVKINGISNINQVSEINAAVNIKVLVKLLLIGLFLTIISSLSAMVSIAGFSPLTILKERS